MLKFTLKQLEIFTAVAECSSFTLAAERLYLTQSTVSIHIASLENALGAPVFQRENRKKIQLTPAGQIVYHYARDILERCEEMEQAAARKAVEKLKIGASSVPSQCLLPPLMAGFIRQSQGSNCSFVLRKGDSTSIHDLLREGAIRIGFVGTALDRAAMDYTPLLEDQLVVITPCTERFRRLKESGVSGDALLGEPMIVREIESGSRREFEHYLLGCGFPLSELNIVAEIDQPATIMESVSKGMGISVISAMVAATGVQEGRLLTFSLGDGLHRSIYLATRKNFSPSREEQEFLDFVREACRDFPSDI